MGRRRAAAPLQVARPRPIKGRWATITARWSPLAVLLSSRSGVGAVRVHTGRRGDDGGRTVGESARRARGDVRVRPGDGRRRPQAFLTAVRHACRGPGAHRAGRRPRRRHVAVTEAGTVGTTESPATATPSTSTSGSSPAATDSAASTDRPARARTVVDFALVPRRSRRARRQDPSRLRLRQQNSGAAQPDRALRGELRQVGDGRHRRRPLPRLQGAAARRPRRWGAPLARLVS